jgi:hypothetical protein
MARSKDNRETLQKASCAYYSHLAYYIDPLVQQERQVDKGGKLELDFLKSKIHPI